jgi:hypothetical protein
MTSSAVLTTSGARLRYRRKVISTAVVLFRRFHLKYGRRLAHPVVMLVEYPIP